MRTTTRLPVDQRLGNLVKRAEQVVVAGKTAVLRDLDLTVPQYSALLVLGEHPGISGANLARRCMVTPQTMATMLANLETRGLVERRRSEDHGQVLVSRLTRSGQALLRKADERAVELERRIADAFTDTERDDLRRYVERLIAAVEPSAR
ncbi:MarR family transcriptional regulator [Actinoplanes italicus]|uniref:DNA-binding MarR family transcriptional regulator n=1 Tax=Actinoplanes italicus TaxID=113567 RepID=A0A2T0KPN3_9ACTN|nr:MarR family transcriptional regulator [Actinoplanes italicus]PRX25688.1 DNA-binding MarR family transcriptional regulator [Actinoplanes italicus]GIE28860.1 MarR family transcriptional regulator [Actinoplanes italicus]